MELLEALRQQNPFAQKRVYDQFVGRMFRVCRRYVRNDEEARDLLMAGFVKFFQRIQTIEWREQQALEPYLRKLMVNECLQHLRRQKISYVAVDELPEHQQPFQPPDEHWSSEDVYRLILELPDGYRTVFNLYAIEGYTHREIAEQLQISENTSKSQLHKARQLLQEKLRKRGYDYGKSHG